MLEGVMVRRYMMEELNHPKATWVALLVKPDPEILVPICLSEFLGDQLQQHLLGQLPWDGFDFGRLDRWYDDTPENDSHQVRTCTALTFDVGRPETCCPYCQVQPLLCREVLVQQLDFSNGAKATHRRRRFLNCGCPWYRC